MFKKKILITGCAGFIGSAVSKELIIRGYEVWGLDNLSTGKKKNLPKKLKFIKGNCADKKILEKIKNNFYAILHFAGQSSGEKSFYDPLRDVFDNLVSTVNLLTFAEKIRCKHFIFASSMSVYGDANKINSEHKTCFPKSIYGVSKFSSENYIKVFQKKGVNSTVLRLFNVYGAGQYLDRLNQGMIRIFFNQVLNTGNLKVKGSKFRSRDFIYITDVVDIVCNLIRNKKAYNQTYNICTGSSYTVYELVNKIKKIIKKKFKTRYLKSTPLDQFRISARNDKIKNLLKFKHFISLDEGLERFNNSLNKNNIK